MPETLRSEQRTARKNYHCGMCNGPINSGDRYHASTNLYDGRVYDFRTCSGCHDDRVLSEVYDWAGMPDEGVTFETAWEWAHEARDAGPGHPAITRMAEGWLSRCGCTCERCEHTTPPTADERAALATSEESDNE